MYTTQEDGAFVRPQRDISIR
jgi:hypothetical protein